MWETFEAAVGFIPHGRLLVAAVLVVCGAQLCAIVLGLRRRLSPGTQAIQGTSLLLIPILAAVSFRASWITTLGGLAGAPASGVQAFTDGLNGLVNASPMAAVGTLIALELWAIGLAVALGQREPEMPATAARGALVFAGLSATLVGVVLCGSYAIHELASLADVEPERKATMLRAALDFTRDHLMRFALISRWTILGLGALAMVFVVRDPKASSRRALARQAMCAAVLLLFAAGLTIVARPLRAETELAWPPPSAGEYLLAADPITPDLVGPDAVERAPVVQIFVDRLALDGDKVTADDLRDRLLTLRNNFILLRPGVAFDGVAVIVADRAASTSQLRRALGAVHEAGYLSPMFAFARSETRVRPLFGPVTRVHATAVRAGLFDRIDDDVDRGLGKDLSDRGVIVPLERFTSYESLARRLVEARRTGSAVSVRLGD